MLRITLLVVLLVALAASAFGQTSTPQFREFRAKGKYSGKNARVILTREDRMFRTVLRSQAREKPNFAGHYILGAWGCGTGCLMGAVIDANTGKVFWFPATICCWSEIERDPNFSPIQFRLDSRLVVFTGSMNETGDLGTHYFEFGKAGFKHIRTIKPK